MSSSAGNSRGDGNPVDNNKCCAKCGARRGSQVTLSKCSRCLRVKYCSKTCQQTDWKRHKRAECATVAGTLPLKASKQVCTMTGPELAASLFRAVTVAEPKNVLCCCWCCGTLLKVCGERGLNPSNDLTGPFWTKTYGRINPEDGIPVRGKTFPALAILGEPGSTGYYTGMNTFGEASACHWCARVLLVCEEEDGAEKHLQKFENYLYDDKFRAAQKTLPDLNVSEKRLLARITMEQNPNLSDGALSVGGYMKKESRSDQDKKIDIPYSYTNFEHLAFPFLLAEAAEFDGKIDLLHYTVMRLYSADKVWRGDYDYVAFSILRLAAYGAANAKEMIHKLPKPISLSRVANLPNDHFQQIGLIPGFH